MNGSLNPDVTVSPKLTTFAAMPRKPPASEIDYHAGLRLKAVRETFDVRGPINQEYFAQKIGVSRPAVANWEGGKMPDIRAMVRLAHWIGIPLEWIYLGQVSQVSFELAERLAKRAIELGASVEGLPEKPSTHTHSQFDIEGDRPPVTAQRGRATRIRVAGAETDPNKH